MSRIGRPSFSIQLMTGDDISAALDLCRVAGWNQVRADWRRLICYEPQGCFAAFSNERLVGTVTTTSYGRELAWIGMMLVDPDFRRQGIATALMRTAIECLRSNDVECIKLDATPAGENVYTTLDFEAEWSFHRWCRRGSNGVTQIDSSRTVALPEPILQLDQRAFGADRRAYLELLATSSSVVVKPDGYGMLRSGGVASYLGPVAAATPATAEEIVVELSMQVEGDLFWDIPSPNSTAEELARTLGLAPVRELTRMRLGTNSRAAELNLQFALADPGTG